MNIPANQEEFPNMYLEGEGKKTKTTHTRGWKITHIYVSKFLMRLLKLCSNWKGIFLCSTVENNY